ncbi:hypothetical protein BDN70DRAFT_76614 [Pholiota conissans]|uniref:Malate dehydrogenase n=1 Tax=Pholiota conissans TaxID=109636 RepID=A0A9P5YY81_9AGAR|nr:hypothetical protein BDN70DRAFT_76614 [Pholiota conissans]
MVSITTLVSLALTAPLMASALVMKRAECNVNNLAIPNLAGLPAPTAKGAFVGIALGTQNYTCTSAGVYTNVGALAELFDISCLTKSPFFEALPDILDAAWQAAPPSITAPKIIQFLHSISSPEILGQHYYVTNPITGSGINPKWDFTSQGATAGNKDAFVVAAKTAGIAAPTGTANDVDWVFLSAIQGKLASQVYRTDTRGGQPPATCDPASDPIVVKYVAKYWGFGSTL